MFATLFTAAGLISLVTLVLMEIVLGIDNILFIAIITSYLPHKADQHKARIVGLSLALLIRIVLLGTISWISHLTHPMFTLLGLDVSGRDIILFAGGVFLIYKAVKEIYVKIEGSVGGHKPKETKLTLTQAIIQITLIDIVFSFDSILTAVGLSNDLVIMISAVTISMLVMLLFAPYVSDFIIKYPTLKMLALAFLVCIGVLLITESLHIHIDKTYVYVAMAFSLIVELLNIRLRKVKHQVY